MEIFNNKDIFFNLPPTLDHLHPLQVENCDSNPRLVVDEDDSGKFKLCSFYEALFISTTRYRIYDDTITLSWLL